MTVAEHPAAPASGPVPVAGRDRVRRIFLLTGAGLLGAAAIATLVRHYPDLLRPLAGGKGWIALVCLPILLGAVSRERADHVGTHGVTLPMVAAYMAFGALLDIGLLSLAGLGLRQVFAAAGLLLIAMGIAGYRPDPMAPFETRHGPTAAALLAAAVLCLVVKTSFWQLMVTGLGLPLLVLLATRDALVATRARRDARRGPDGPLPGD